MGNRTITTKADIRHFVKRCREKGDALSPTQLDLVNQILVKEGKEISD